MSQFGRASGPTTFGKKPVGRKRAPASRPAEPELSPEARDFLASQRQGSTPSKQSGSTTIPTGPDRASHLPKKRGGRPVALPRMFAYLIDSLIIGLPFVILAWAPFTAEMNAMNAGYPFALADSNAELVLLKWLLYYCIIKTIYAVALESSAMQATFGKSLLGLIVTNSEKTKPGLGQVIMRNTLARMIFNVIPLWIGHLMISWHPKRKGIHDMMAGTMVCRLSHDTAEDYSSVFA